MRIWSRFLNRRIEGNVVDIIWHWKVDGHQIEIRLLFSAIIQHCIYGQKSSDKKHTDASAQFELAVRILVTDNTSHESNNLATWGSSCLVEHNFPVPQSNMLVTLLFAIALGACQLVVEPHRNSMLRHAFPKVDRYWLPLFEYHQDSVKQHAHIPFIGMLHFLA
jgi:hypothetical protein